MPGTPRKPATKRPVKRKPGDEARTRLHRHVVGTAYLQKRAHLRTSEERKALRVTSPRESQAGFTSPLLAATVLPTVAAATQALFKEILHALRGLVPI